MTVVHVLSPVDEAIAIFQTVDLDCRLVMIWQSYETLGQAFASVAPLALFSQAVQQLVKQLTQISREEQIDVLHDILSGAETRFTLVYRQLNPNMKLAFWHRLFSRRDWPQILASHRAMGQQLACDRLRLRLSTMGLNERLHFLRQVLA